MKLPFSKQASPQSAQPTATPTLLKLDLGCGTRKKEGFLGIDRRKFAGVDGVTDLTKKKWIFDDPELGGLKLLPATEEGKAGFALPDNCVSEAYSSHFLEHLEHNQRQPERVRFMNELWRVLVPGGTATIITPHWASHRAYGDFTHADKPVAEMFYVYLDRAWREDNAPDNDIEFNPDGYCCDFESILGHGLHPEISKQSQEAQDFALQWYREAAEELHAKLVAKK
jgi:SAM-dependent methyltransferase